jgi:hypothetical protein
MGRAISSIPLAMAVSSSKIMLFVGSNSGLPALASAVDMAYENSLDTIDHKPPVGEECSFEASSRHHGKGIADTGILGSCSDPHHVCVEDKQSSLGGRCLMDKVQRELQTTCTTKCEGTDACGGGTDPSIIDNRSCCGFKACFGITGTQQSKSRRTLLTFTSVFALTSVFAVQDRAKLQQEAVSAIWVRTEIKLKHFTLYKLSMYRPFKHVTRQIMVRNSHIQNSNSSTAHIDVFLHCCSGNWRIQLHGRQDTRPAG